MSLDVSDPTMLDSHPSASMLQRFLPEIIHFNYQSSVGIHADHLGRLGIDTPVFEALTQTESGRTVLSRLIVQRFELNDAYTEFDAPQSRIALLHGRSIESLIRYGAAAVLGKNLRTVLRKADRDYLKRKLGAQEWDFGIRQADLVVGRSMLEYRQLLKLPDTLSSREGLLSAFFEVARSILWDVLPWQQTACSRRVCLKLPRWCDPDSESLLDVGEAEARGDSHDGEQDLVNLATTDPQRSTAAWGLTRKLLRTTIGSKWLTYFEF